MRTLINTEFISYYTGVSCHIASNVAISEGKPHATPKESEVGGAVILEAKMVRYLERITVSIH